MEEPDGVAVYVDESVHDALGFIVCAFVFGKRAKVTEETSNALRGAGLTPGVDEFKSGAYMLRNAAQQELREAHLGIAGKCQIALGVCPTELRPDLGVWCLDTLATVIRSNGFRGVAIEANFDEGLFHSRQEAENAAAKSDCLKHVSIGHQQDSKVCLGIQVADVVAHSTGQVIRYATTGGAEKMVGIGGPGTGYADDEVAPLGWSLRMSFRYGMLRRPTVLAGDAIDPDVNPRIVGPNEDLVAVAQNPDVLGWGVHVHPELPAEIRTAVESELSTVWLGCIH